MALPVSVQTVTVHFGPFLDFQGNALQGATTFEPFNRSVLLEDLTGAEPVAYFKTYRSGNFLINGAWRWNVPSFAGDSKR